jgi:hypothetical protein
VNTSGGAEKIFISAFQKMSNEEYEKILNAIWSNIALDD